MLRLVVYFPTSSKTPPRGTTRLHRRHDLRHELAKSNNHGSLWTTLDVVHYMLNSATKLAHFAQCRLGCAAQKTTTIMYSPALAGTFDQLRNLLCQHGNDTHEAPVRVHTFNGEYTSKGYAARTMRLTAITALAIADADTFGPTPIHSAVFISGGTPPCHRYIHPIVRNAHRQGTGRTSMSTTSSQHHPTSRTSSTTLPFVSMSSFRRSSRRGAPDGRPIPQITSRNDSHL